MKAKHFLSNLIIDFKNDKLNVTQKKFILLVLNFMIDNLKESDTK